VPLPPLRDPRDPDEKRREIVWIAISFIVILASWLAVVLIFGYPPLVMGMTYDEVVLLSGLGLLLLCSVLYLAAREREERAANRGSVARLRGAVEGLDARVEMLNGLCSVSAELAGTADLDQVSRVLVGAAAEATEGDSAHLGLVERETGRVVYERHYPAVTSAEEARSAQVRWAELAAACDDHAEMEATAEGGGGMIWVPVRLSNGLSGVLVAVREEGKAEFAPEHRRVLSLLANMAAKAIENSQLQAELRERYLATVRSLVNSLHARDNYTAAHSERTAKLAVSIAEHLDLPDEMVREIEMFGPLHDVGKIGIDDDVLLKATPLSERERAACREHCVIGEGIIRPLKPSASALGMVRHHHEAWDGSGYPDGLKGKEIPVLARVLQVADCYDAMIAERPYQPALSEQEVLAHFEQHAGRAYDAKVVAALVEVMRGGGGAAGEAAGRTEDVAPERDEVGRLFAALGAT
jgi:hypothetical protein